MQITWKKTNIKKLRRLAKQGYSSTEIAKKFKGTRPAIQRKCFELKLKLKNNLNCWTSKEIALLHKCAEENKTLKETKKIIVNRKRASM